MDAVSQLDSFLGEVDEQGKAVKDRTKARFEERPFLDKAKTEEAGRPIYENRIYVCIKCPKRDPIDLIAKDHHKKRFPRAWQEFRRVQKMTSEGEVQGTPVLEWNGIPATQARELYAMGFLSVESLASADISEHPHKKSLELLQGMAKRFIEQETGKDQEIAQLKAELEQRDTSINGAKRSGGGGAKAS